MYIFKHVNKVFTYKTFSMDFEISIILNILIFTETSEGKLIKFKKIKLKSDKLCKVKTTSLEVIIDLI